MPLALLLVLSSIAFITMKGSRILMTLYAVDLGAGPFETGILFALYGLFPFLLAIAAGLGWLGAIISLRQQLRQKSGI